MHFLLHYTQSKCKSKCRPITQKILLALRSKLAATNWNLMFESNNNARTVYTKFHNRLAELFKANFPEKEIKIVQRGPIWFSDNLREMCAKLEVFSVVHRVIKTEESRITLNTFGKQYKNAI